MGSLVSLSCQKCKYHETFRLGQGMMDYSNEKILKHFEGSARDDAAAVFLDPDEASSWFYDKVLGQCKSCHNIQEVPILINKKIQGRYIYSKCNNCNDDLKLWISDCVKTTQTDDMPICPHCGSSMSAEASGLWD